jgi:lipopolysaccharide export system permease protein
VRLAVYILLRSLGGVLTALAVISAVILLIEFVELSRSVGARSDADLLELMRLTGLRAPAAILTLLPFAFLFGTMGAFVAVNRRNELVAMRAAGVSAWRFVLPVALAALAIGVVSVVLLNPLATALNAAFEDSRAALTAGSSAAAPRETWLRQTDRQGQAVLRAASKDLADGRVRLHDVTIFLQSSPAGTFDRRIEAREAVLAPGEWRLSQVTEARAGAETVRAERLSLPSTLDRSTALETFTPPAMVDFWDLPRTIRAAETAGYSSAAYRLRWLQLLASPVLLAAMSLLGASFCLRLLRLGDLALVAGVGVATGFATFFLNQFCGALGLSGAAPMLLAVWAAPILALLSAVTLLCYTEDG